MMAGRHGAPPLPIKKPVTLAVLFLVPLANLAQLLHKPDFPDGCAAFFQPAAWRRLARPPPGKGGDGSKGGIGPFIGEYDEGPGVRR